MATVRVALLAIFLVASSLLLLGVRGQKRECAKGKEFAYDLKDCNKFFTCVGPLSYRMSCQPGLVFSMERKGCVFQEDVLAKDCPMKAVMESVKKAGLEYVPFNDGGDGDANLVTEDNPFGDGEANMATENKPFQDDGAKNVENYGAKKDQDKMGDLIPADDTMSPKEGNETKVAMNNDKKEDNEDVDNVDNNNNIWMGGNEDATDVVKAINDKIEADLMGMDDISLLVPDLNGFGAPPPENSIIAVDEHCISGQDIVPHDTLCHRFYNCTQSYLDVMNKFLTPFEYECPYPQLFSVDTLSCEDFQNVDCGVRMEYLDPCDYAENMCSGPNCKECTMEHGSCVGLPDGRNYWPGREGSGFFLECRSQRTIAQDNCNSNDYSQRNVFSNNLKRCTPYDQVIKEVCQWSEMRLPQPNECHLFYDCSAFANGDQGDSDNNGAAVSASGSTSPLHYVRMCPYPMLYSVRSGKCEEPDKVDCGTRREAKTPCDYMPTECVDPSYASCDGLPDGQNVFRTREGTPHYVVCEKDRTMERGMCEMDDRGIYKQFSPGMGKCMEV